MFPSPSNSWMSASPLEILITRACEPTLPEPNYALQLEIAEYINKKKANTAREAAQLLVRLVNHRNPHVGMLALSTIDTLSQSCGYSFHLQVATKEFLNELVRRFPERPPPYPGAVMQRILDVIAGWKEGICQDSRWKNDLGNIRDMHRLLTFKGYRFREVPRAGTVAAATDNLKSADELEEEDREAQSAKLQELIRRGTPRDLAAAQEIMKSLAGANPDAKPDYRGQALADLGKLEQKVVLLNELLDNFDTNRGERFASGDAYDQVANILSGARPKIQKWINDAESDDSESLDTFLQLNDGLNTVLNRYDAFKRGDYVAASNPVPPELASNAPAPGGLGSLIDLDDNDALASLASPPQQTPSQHIMNNMSPPPPQYPPVQPSMPDLFSLLDGTSPTPSRAVQSPYGQNGGPSYGSPHSSSAHPSSSLFSGAGAAGSARSTTPSTPMGTITLPGTPGRMTSPPPPLGYGAGIGQPQNPHGNNPTMGGWMGMNAPQAVPQVQTMQQQQQQRQQQQPGMFGGNGSNGMGQSMQPQAPGQVPTQSLAQGQQGKDPFADLAGIF